MFDVETHGNVDPHLLALADAAERRKPCPSGKLLVGSWVVVGVPVDTHTYMQSCYGSFYREAEQDRAARKFNGSPEQKHAAIRDALVPVMESFDKPHGTVSDRPVALNLINVSVAGAVGTGLQVPAVRVPLATVSAWWVTSASVVQPSGGGLSFGVGVIF